MPPVSAGLACHICGRTSGLSWCSRCHKITYCSKEHQVQDWKLHKKLCQPVSIDVASNVSPLNLQNSFGHAFTSEREISENSTSSDEGKTLSSSPTDMQAALLSTSNSVKLEKYFLKDVTNADTNMAATIWQSLQNHGLVILNNFLPKEQAEEVRRSIVSMYAAPGNFTDGEVMSACKLKSEQVRGDRVRWIDECYSGCEPLQLVFSKLDKLIQLCCDMSTWMIESRTKPMVTCYPGNGACYKRHVDNPTQDGRLLTCLYYINEEWNEATDGGCLCLYPQGGSRNYMVKCEPVFNRICLFLSNSSVPHEVQPTYKQRFAVTCWYFDRDERQRALMRWAQKSQVVSGSMQDCSLLR